MIEIDMKRKVIFLIGLVILIIAIILVVTNLANRGPKFGELRVNSDPTASVFLDDKHVGRTPIDKFKQASGEYVIKIVPESATSGLSQWEGKIKIGTNLLTYVNASLAESELNTAVDVLWLEKITSRQSELDVITNPDGATVSLDDVTKGVTPIVLNNITPGDHILMITSPGFITRNFKIKTTVGYKLIAQVKLGLSTGGTVSSATPSATPTILPTGSIKPTPKGTPGATPTDPPKPFVIIKDTPTGFLRVRVEPSTTATEAARVNPGDKFPLVDSGTGWYEIQYDATSKGWISAQYAEKVE